MTLDEAVATLRVIASHQVDGCTWDAGASYATVDFCVTGSFDATDVVDAAHDLAEAASIVCAVLEDRWAGYRLGRIEVAS